MTQYPFRLGEHFKERRTSGFSWPHGPRKTVGPGEPPNVQNTNNC